MPTGVVARRSHDVSFLNKRVGQIFRKITALFYVSFGVEFGMLLFR